jgi:hypothetical protein
MTTEEIDTREGSGIGEPMLTSEAFATAEAGSDYFETDAHYRALADRILGSVHDDRPFIVVIGDPPPSPHSLSASLDEAVAHQQPVMVLSCGPMLRGDALLDVCRGLAAHTQANDSQPGALPFPLFIFDDAGQLADEQIRDVYKTSQSINHWIVVMLGGTDFLARLEQPEIRFARDELTTALHFQELGPLEILPYIRHQLGADAAAQVFTDDVVAVLRARAGGDPRIVNRLALDLIHDAAGIADVPGSASLPSAEEPAPEAFEQPALPDLAATPFVPPAAPPPGPYVSDAPDIPAEVPASADENTLLDRLERRLHGVTAETAAAPASPLPAEQPTGETPDQPPQLSLGTQPAALEMPHQESDAAIGAGTATAVSPPVDEEAQAVLAQPAAPAAPLPDRRRAANLPWPAIAGVLCLIGVGWAGSVILDRQAGRVASGKAGAEGASSAAPKPVSSATPEPTRPAPSPPPRAVPSATVEPKANAVPAPPPPAAAEPPRPAAPPTAAPETTAAPAASPAVPSATVPPQAAPPAVPSATVPPQAAAPAVLTPTEPARAPVVALGPGAPPAPGVPPPTAVRPAAAELAALVARGDEFFVTGDVASARLFYERAADAGDAQAALRMGESFDPGFLDQARVRGAKGDPAKAISWYRRARELGSAEAEILLKSPEGK